MQNAWPVLQIGKKMSLTTEQKQTLISIDQRANQILLAGGNEEDLLKAMHFIMNDLKKIIGASTHNELNAYCQKYNGFYRFMKLMEKLAVAISNGTPLMPS